MLKLVLLLIGLFSKVFFGIYLYGRSDLNLEVAIDVASMSTELPRSFSEASLAKFSIFC